MLFTCSHKSFPLAAREITLLSFHTGPVKLLALCNPLPKECLWQKWCNTITQGGQYFTGQAYQ